MYANYHMNQENAEIFVTYKIINGRYAFEIKIKDGVNYDDITIFCEKNVLKYFFDKINILNLKLSNESDESNETNEKNKN